MFSGFLVCDIAIFFMYNWSRCNQMVSNYVINFLCVNEKLYIFPTCKYNPCLPLDISSHLVPFLSKLAGHLRMKNVSHR